MKRIALLALIPTVLSIATAAYPGTPPKGRNEGLNITARDCRPGEEWNDCAIRQGWWGRGRSEAVSSAVVAPAGEPQRGTEGQSTASSQGLSDAELAPN